MRDAQEDVLRELARFDEVGAFAWQVAERLTPRNLQVQGFVRSISRMTLLCISALALRLERGFFERAYERWRRLRWIGPFQVRLGTLEDQSDVEQDRGQGVDDPQVEFDRRSVNVPPDRERIKEVHVHFLAGIDGFSSEVGEYCAVFRLPDALIRGFVVPEVAAALARYEREVAGGEENDG